MDEHRRRAMLNAFDTLAKELQEQYGFSAAELTARISNKEDAIPATAFDNKLTPFETLVVYLQKTHDVKQIGKILGRAPSIIEKTRDNARKKNVKLEFENTPYLIPAGVFADKELSFTEHLCAYLKNEYELSNAEIGRLTGMDQRTVWTILARAKKKRGGDVK